jgi:phenylpyruvate tautomerase PptA (4-oxalocrotonate tautomerase family)
VPLVRITCPRGALLPEQKRQLANALTEIVLEAEVDVATDAGRAVTVVHFAEAEAEDWAVGGRLRASAANAPNHFIVDLIVLEGLLDGARRSEAHRRVTEAFQKACGETGDPLLPLRVWVLVHEVREGSWGAGGRPVSALDVARFIHPELTPARRDEITASLAARRTAD